MKIVIILDEQYPNGMAASNRTHLYSRELAALGNDVQILVPRAMDQPGKILNHDPRGVFEGVKFRYGYEIVMRKSFFGRRIQNIQSLIRSFFFLVRYKPDIILIVSNDLKLNILGKIVAALSGAKTVREKTEVPFYHYELLSERMKMRLKAEFRMFDGIIVISPALMDFFKNDLELKTRMIEIPILVAINGHEKAATVKPASPTFVYTGSLIDHKDGVVTIIEAFAKIVNSYPESRLILTGDIEHSEDRNLIQATIKKYRLEDKIELTGYISREKMNELTSAATALLLAKPPNRQNRYNMATKVGEYLITGRPAIVSSVDPVCRYLSHRENALIIEPDKDRMAEEINFIINHPGEAENIGKAGKESAIRLFDIKKHALRMEQFFVELKHEK